MKKSLFLILKPFLRLLFRAFFHKKYLSSEYFDDSRGYIWCLRAIISRNLLRLNVQLPFPCHHSSNITDWRNLDFNPDDIHNFQSQGCYFQCSKAKITLGKRCYIGPNVAVITANHNPCNLEEHNEGKPVYISENCWIGFGSVILPGVYLAPGTVVAANSVVTKSVFKGAFLIAGSPAKKIKRYDV